MSGRRVTVQAVEKIDLHVQPAGKRRVRAWASGTQASWRYSEVAVWQLADGRWVAQRIGQRDAGAWLADSEAQAQTAVEAWMRRHGGVWREIPAGFDGRGMP